MKYLYFALIALGLASCGKEKKIDHSKTDWAHFQLEGQVESVSEKSFSASKDASGKQVPTQENFSDHDTDLHFNENGLLILEKKWLGDGKPFEELKYNGRDKKIEYIQYVNGTPSIKTIYSWDKSGKYNTSIARQNTDNTQIEKIKFRYKGGLLYEKSTHNTQDIITDKVGYVYGKNSNLIAENAYLNKESVQYRTAYEYDSKNRKISESRYEPGGKSLSKITYDYSGDQLASKNNFNDKNEVEYYEKYEYDNKGNVTAKVIFSKMDGEATEVYTYDNNNNKTSWSSLKDGKIMMRVTYKYDKFNNLRAYEATNERGEITEAKAYKLTYDEEGNWISKTIIVGGKPKFIIKRTITYF